MGHRLAALPTDPTKKPYKVSERLDTGWECYCPAWTRHMPRVDCKHIILVRKAGSKINTLTVQAPPIVSDGYTIVERFDRRRNLIETLPDPTTPRPTRGRRDI